MVWRVIRFFLSRDGFGREEKPGAGFPWEGVYLIFAPIAQQHCPPIGFAAWQWESFPPDPSFSFHLELSSTGIVAAGLPVRSCGFLLSNVFWVGQCMGLWYLGSSNLACWHSKWWGMWRGKCVVESCRVMLLKHWGEEGVKNDSGWCLRKQTACQEHACSLRLRETLQHLLLSLLYLQGPLPYLRGRSDWLTS